MKPILLKLPSMIIALLSLIGYTQVSFPEEHSLPVIDMHLHAIPLEYWGETPRVCAPGREFPAVDPQNGFNSYEQFMSCTKWHMPARSNQEMMEKTLEELSQYNVVLAVTSGSMEMVKRWQQREPNRIMPSLMLSPSTALNIDDVRKLIVDGEIKVIGEILTQLDGMSPNDPWLEPYYALAEELDVPVGIHIGTAGPGFSTLNNAYRSSYSNALLLEEVLLAHPHLRLYVMHAGWPMLDELLLLLLSFPQVYAEISYLNWGHTREDFNFYLRRLVEAGFGKRILFGSDHSIWPGILGVAIDAVQSADYLTETQKRDILYNNARRFLRINSKH